MARKANTEDCGAYLIEKGDSVSYIHSCRQDGTQAGRRCIKDLLIESGVPRSRLKQYGVCKADGRRTRN